MTLAPRIKAVLIAVVLCAAFVSVGWVSRFPYTFPDLQNYREGFESGWYVYSVINLDWLHFLLSEGSWVYGFDGLWRWTGNIDISFYIVSCAATFLIIHYIFCRTQSYIAILFIFNPAFVNSVMEQLRSGLATGIFLNATLIKRPILQIPLFILALSIHSAFILFVAFYYLYRFFNLFKIKNFFDRHFLASLVIMFFLALVIAYLRDFALASIGDSRAFVQEDQTSGGLLFIAWCLFLVSFYFFRYNTSPNFDVYFFTLNVFMLGTSLLMGDYGQRFVAIGIPALAAMTCQIKIVRRPLFYGHYFLFSAVYFVVWAY